MRAFSWLVGASAKIAPTGFKNKYYQAPGYLGSRVLEWDQIPPCREQYEEHYDPSCCEVYPRKECCCEPYTEFNWTQSIAVDGRGRMWIAEKSYHVIVLVNPRSEYIPEVDFPAYYEIFVGQWDIPGYYDGSSKVARFNGPSGIAIDSYDPTYLFVADTNNHCVRRISIKDGRTTTVGGAPERPGLMDGKGLRAQFRFPMSIGIDQHGLVYVLDNVNRIRVLHISEGQTASADVYTLVDGACRAIRDFTLLETVIVRVVGCHHEWYARDTPEDVGSWMWQKVCVGHAVTCGPRHHPGFADRYSNLLISEEDSPALKNVE
jgi:hypothetical protein